jgi:hypothetical protein
LTTSASGQRPTTHQIVPLHKMPSDQWIENVSGDASKAGLPFVIRIHNDAGYVCPPHTHPTRERHCREGNVVDRHSSARCPSPNGQFALDPRAATD